MILKWIFDRVVAFVGLCFLWPVLLIVAIMVKVKMPGGPAFFVQKRVGKDGKLFTCHKFRSMTVAPKVEKGKDGKESKEGWSSVSVAGDSRITPFGATLRHYKLDELPGLWDVLIGNMSFVGPRPDVPGYADKLEGDDRVVLNLRPGITGPATLKYRLEDEMIADFVSRVRELGKESREGKEGKEGKESKEGKEGKENKESFGFALPENVKEMTNQELAIWYNDNVIYPDKVRLNKYYYEHYSFVKDIQMIFATVLGFNVKFAGEEI